MTHLPINGSDVIVRVEPQIADLTAKAYLTPPKSNAALLVVSTGPYGAVHHMEPFANWFASKFYFDFTVAPALKVACDLDNVDDIGVAFAFEKVFVDKAVPAEHKVLAINAMPARLLDTPAHNGQHEDHFGNYSDKDLRGVLKELLQLGGATPELKAAIEKKLAEPRQN